MDDEIDIDTTLPIPTAARPLLGLTILVVEDSRFASEAMRLLCLRSGARIRRADCLRSARRHLQVYRPSVAVVDMGLPDGSGAELIGQVSAASPRIPVILGISGDEYAEAPARAAGADGFLTKPILRLSDFQDAVLSHMPADRRPRGPRLVQSEQVEPDRIAFRDDMAHLAGVLDEDREGRQLDYVAQFLRGVAISASDMPLADAAAALAKSRREGRTTAPEVARITGLLRDRLSRHSAI